MVFDNQQVMHGYAQQSENRSEAETIFPQSSTDSAEPEPDLGNKVFQLVFAGLDGATFPLGYFPVRKWNSIDILSTIVEAVEYLHLHGFVVSIQKPFLKQTTLQRRFI